MLDGSTVSYSLEVAHSGRVVYLHLPKQHVGFKASAVICLERDEPECRNPPK